jgi:hypothetical protein
MDCPHCGTHNLDEAERCRICANLLRPDAGPKGPTKACPFCKTENDVDAPFCSNCAKPFGARVVEEPERRARREKYYDRTYADIPGSAARTHWTGLGGILVIMMVFFALADVVLTIAIYWEISTWAEYDQLLRENPQYEGVVSSLMVCEGVRILFLLIAFAGAIFAIKRLRWGLAMFGSVLGVLALLSGILLLLVPWWGLIELFMLVGGVAGIVMIGVCRKEFLLV